MATPRKSASARRRADEEAQQSKPEKPAVNPIIPIGLMLFTLGAVIYYFVDSKSDAAAAPPAAAKTESKPKEAKGPTPFDDLPKAKPAETDKPSTFTLNGKTYPIAPASISEDANWKKAQGIAAEGDKLLAEALALGDDKAAVGDKNKAASKKFNEAIELTASWEESLLDKYSDHDPRIADIVKLRSGWIQKLNALDSAGGH